MDEQARGTEMPRGGGIRKFMNDPKSSVMSYLAESMAAQHLQQQQMQQQNPGTGGPQQNSSSYGQQYPNQGSNSLSNQFQNPGNGSQTSLTPSQTAQTSGNFQPPSSQPGYSQQSQNSPMPPSTSHLASNIGSSQQESHVQAPQQPSQNQGSDMSMTSLGKAPPTSSMKHTSSPQSAPRLYHRMNLDFEATKSAFFTARAQHNSQEMTSAAYDLESLSRRIWSLRFEHAWEFEGFQESGHQTIIAHWQAQYELWADTVLDIQEGDSAASMFSVHRTASVGTAISATPSINAIAPESGAAANNAYNQPQQPPYQQGLGSNPPAQAPTPGQQGFGNQSPSMGPTIPVNQIMQSSPPSQYMPPGSMPGGLPSTGAPSGVGNASQQTMPFQQQSMSPPPQTGSLGQNGPLPVHNGPPPSSQNGPPALGPGPQNAQSMQQNPTPNMQAGSFQPMPPQAQQMPPQQMGQQMQAGPPTGMQQPAYMGQRPPSGPPSNVPPQAQMPQMPPGQGQPPRPDTGLPPSLQAGGR